MHLLNGLSRVYPLLATKVLAQQQMVSTCFKQWIREDLTWFKASCGRGEASLGAILTANRYRSAASTRLLACVESVHGYDLSKGEDSVSDRV
jgi:hypothetical protein